MAWRRLHEHTVFPGTLRGHTDIQLETNYRSVPEILEVANTCIQGNPDQFQKVLRATRAAYKKPCIVRLRDGGEQARFITDRIARLRREGYKLSEIAVLYRAHFHAMELESELVRAALPYTITSGQRFFEQAHVKDVCSLLRILYAPHDELAFLRLLGLLPGVGPKTAEKLWRKLGGAFDVGSTDHRKTVRDGLRPGSRAGWEDIESVLVEHQPSESSTSGSETAGRFLDRFYERYAVNSFENSDRRIDDVRELIVQIEKFRTVEQFLSDVALLTNLDAENDEATRDSAEVVRLSTVHQAKGLEWPVVLVIWAVEDMFPSARTLNEGAGDSEERRLFYVAVTRAKDELYLCVPQVRRMRDGGVMYCRPSRFVDELPGELTQDVYPGFI